jgi:regulator of protease activity HflC (stomatin/prohibitin superfamily)
VANYRQPRFWILIGVVLAALILLQQFWEWEVERVEVEPGNYLVRVHRWGKDLPENEIVAPDESYKGVMLEVLQEGRHFLNPIFWGYEVHKLVNVPTGKSLVLTRKYGKEMPEKQMAEGNILAGPEERGIVAEVLRPGSYRLNPYAYSWDLVPAVEIKADEVGVRTLKVGKDPRELPPDAKRGRYVVPAGYRGVQQHPVQSGTYYINPFVETITPVEVRSHRVELSDIEFPSRDGFILKPHVLVEYRVEAEKAPELQVRLTDTSTLHQADSTPEEQLKNEILQKVILPHIRGYSRIEGSNFDARDFILAEAGAGQEKVANTREKLQRALLAKVQPRCQELGIDIRAVSLTDMTPPADLAEQISLRDLARVEQEKNRNLASQYKEQQILMAAKTMKAQATEKVDAETRLVQEKTKARQRLQVQELQLKQELDSAQLRLEAARKQAEAVVTKGKAEAAVITAKNEAEIAGLRKAIQGFESAQQYAQFHVLERLAPTLKEIFASDESEFAKLFSTYMTAPIKGTKPAVTVTEKTSDPSTGVGGSKPTGSGDSKPTGVADSKSPANKQGGN